MARRIFCTQCGQANPGEARYCASCGTTLAPEGPQPVAGQSSTAAFPAAGAEAGQTAGDEQRFADRHRDVALDLPAGTALLIIKHGPGAGSRLLLDTALTTAGRHPEADIFLDDVTVSRRHAEFHREGGTFTVTDVGSLNGTYVNRDRVETVTLASGDQIQIGKFRLVFLTG